MDFALMFQVLEGGVSEPVQWNIDNLSSDKNILILDEGSSSIFLWHGSKQGLVARRTALRQAESLKGHGYVSGKSIIGRDIKFLKEIDQRKIGRDLETDKFNEELQNILNQDFKELDNYIITFDIEGAKEIPKAVKQVVKQVTQPTPLESKPKPQVVMTPENKVIGSTSTNRSVPTISKPAIMPASEYNVTLEKPIKSEPIPTEKISEDKIKLDLDIEAKIGFVLVAILDHYEDIWVSKKDDGSFSVEQMDGFVCSFKIEGSKITFTADSFKGISSNIKIEIQKKFIELSKLLK